MNDIYASYEVTNHFLDKIADLRWKTGKYLLEVQQKGNAEEIKVAEKYSKMIDDLFESVYWFYDRRDKMVADANDMLAEIKASRQGKDD